MKLFKKCTLLSLSLASGYLHAQTTTYPQSTRSQDQYEPQTKPSMQEPSDQQDQSKVAGWMIESSQAAKDFVAAIDKGQYSQSWNKGDQLFQHTITQSEWTKYLDLERKNKGKVLSRNVRLQNPSWNPKGLPKGPYMVLVYDTSFENKPKAIEVLTLRLGTDGVWRVLTYNVN